MTTISLRKTALITGATSGFGVYIARHLLQQGYRLLLWARTEEKGKRIREQLLQEVPEAAIEIVTANLSSLRSTMEACAWVRERTDALDLLVLNAGLWNFEPVTTVDGIEETLQVNLLAPVLIEKLLHPKLLKAPQAKVIFTASGLHQGSFRFDDPEFKKGFSGFNAYRQSKLGIIMMTKWLALEYAQTGIRYCCVHPGIVQTKLGQKAGWLTRTIFRKLGNTPEKGAATHRHVIGLPWDQLTSGAYYAKCRVMQTTPQSNDPDLAERLHGLIERYLNGISSEKG